MSTTLGQSPACFICRCEEIEEAEILEAIVEGAQSINDVKRRTRAGMGVCQGIYCVQPIAQILERELGLKTDQIVPMTARPPVRCVTLESLAASEDSE
jgi:NAD(P)H-nitrite reductase large subunit